MSLVTLQLQSPSHEETRRLVVSLQACRDAAQRLLLKLQSSTQAGPGQDVVTPIIAAARKFTAVVLSEPDRAWLESQPAGCGLTITGSLESMALPFELLRIGDSWLGSLFSVGRQLNTTFPRSRNSLPSANETVCLAARHEGLLWVTAEEATVSRALHQLAKTTDFLPPRETSIQMSGEEVADSLELCRWFHFAGHGVEQDGQRVLQINDHEMLGGEQMRALEQTPEVMFLNACGSLHVPFDRARGCLVDNCLERGTKWLIGTTVPFTDDGSWEFVKAFYAGVTKGHTMGESMRQARQHCSKVMPNSVTHLAYVLYGAPERVFANNSAQVAGATADAVHVKRWPPTPLKPNTKKTAAESPAPSTSAPAKVPNVRLPKQRPFDADSWKRLISAFQESTTRFVCIDDPANGSSIPVSFHRRTDRKRSQDQWEQFGRKSSWEPPVADYAATIGGPKAKDKRQVTILIQLDNKDTERDLSPIADDEETILILIRPHGVSPAESAAFHSEQTRDGRSVVLFDPENRVAWFRRDDTQIIPWRRLFNLETDQQQTVRVLNWIRDRLPTPVSILSRDVCKKLIARESPVEQAFRLAAATENVQLQQTEEFGLVLDHDVK